MPFDLQFMDEISAIWDWCVRHKENITFGIALLAFFRPLAPLGWLIHRRATVPKLVFALEHGRSDEEVVVRIANVGASVAADVRLRWVARSGMTMVNTPQPATILAGAPLDVHLSIDRLNLLAHGTGFSLSTAKRSDPLGWLEVQYPRLGRKARTGRSIILSEASDGTAVSSLVTLDKLPRRPLKEKVQIVGWLLKPWEQRRERKEAEQRAREDAEIFQRAQEKLKANGIEIGSTTDAGEGEASKWFGELGRRGWEWEFQSGGVGYEVVARKTWLPSSSMTIRMTGETLSEALTLALASAIWEDEERGTTPGNYPTSLRDHDPLKFPPSDPRHDTDF